MPRSHCLSVWLALCGLVTTTRAQTFVVDAANGPGTHFTSLVAAVAAVPDGAVLDVRPGSYAGFSLSGKGLTVLGQPGVAITSTIAIGNTQAHHTIVLRELAWPTAQLASGNTLLQLDTCRGPVLLEHLAQPPHTNCLPGSPLGGCHRTTGLSAQRCAQLAVQQCTLQCTAQLVDCDTLVVGSTIAGESAFLAWTMQAGRTALLVQGGRVQIAGASTVTGGNGYPAGRFGAAAGHGVGAVGGDVRILDGIVGAGVNGWLPGYTVWTSGATLRIAPRVALFGPFGPLIGTDVMPTASGQGAAPGGTLTAAVRSEPGDVVIVVVGLPGPPTLLAGAQDAFWIDAGVHVFATVGVQGVAPVTANVAVPPIPALRGTRLHWQGACFGPATGFQASNPVVALVH
jgi:hypothetical protein